MDIFTALAVPTRRNIIEIIAKRGRLSATDISNNFSMSPPAISQHLKILREVKLVTMEREGKYWYYQLDLKGMYEFERWTQKTTNLWNKRFDALDKVLELEKSKLLEINKKK